MQTTRGTRASVALGAALATRALGAGIASAQDANRSTPASTRIYRRHDQGRDDRRRAVRGDVRLDRGVRGGDRRERRDRLPRRRLRDRPLSQDELRRGHGRLRRRLEPHELHVAVHGLRGAASDLLHARGTGSVLAADHRGLDDRREPAADPRHADISALHYRTDLFDDPDLQAAFEEQYGYPLAVPETLQQMYDMAEFFVAQGAVTYGTQFAGKEEALAGRFYEVLFANGGDYFDADLNRSSTRRLAWPPPSGCRTCTRTGSSRPTRRTCFGRRSIRTSATATSPSTSNGTAGTAPSRIPRHAQRSPASSAWREDPWARLTSTRAGPVRTRSP